MSRWEKFEPSGPDCPSEVQAVHRGAEIGCVCEVLTSPLMFGSAGFGFALAAGTLPCTPCASPQYLMPFLLGDLGGTANRLKLMCVIVAHQVAGIRSTIIGDRNRTVWSHDVGVEIHQTLS